VSPSVDPLGKISRRIIAIFSFGILSYHYASPKIFKNKISILGPGRKVGLI